MISYETALANYKKAEAAYKKASVKLQDANNVLEESKRTLTFECICGHEIKVSDIELIVQMSGGHQSDDYWHYNTRKYFVCPKCHNTLSAPENEELFTNGFEKYVKKIHEWYSDRERCHGRILELLTPHFDIEAEREKKETREKKIREARKLIAEEDNPGNTST